MLKCVLLLMVLLTLPSITLAQQAEPKVQPRVIRPFHLLDIMISRVERRANMVRQETLLFFAIPPGRSNQLINHNFSQDKRSVVLVLKNGDIPEAFARQVVSEGGLISTLVVDHETETITVSFNRPLEHYTTGRVDNGVISFVYYAKSIPERGI